ncbi:MAG: Peptidyl-prolyl cis-trans isomerase [uncultured Aureispira sp.]|uniref:Peptidyl-prolyl cis-trans isomerase n=1 Tax=uncultured Aureispira sp. TaxID=1331704 RepID=A0A6S6U2Q5_9BACT|nr:MAG: Peptidyl-prolyl cis-trans isomerase [uncultured Aureispira sp.]
MKTLFSLVLLLSLSCSFSNCSKDFKAADEASILQYIEDNNLTAIEAQDGLYYTIDVVGTGTQPSGVYSTVTVHYTGKFMDGTTFETSVGGTPYTNSLSSVIKGWQYGIPYFKAGGKGTLLIPSHLAYGATGSGSIGPNEPLVFEIELISAQN